MTVVDKNKARSPSESYFFWYFLKFFFFNYKHFVLLLSAVQLNRYVRPQWKKYIGKFKQISESIKTS